MASPLPEPETKRTVETAPNSAAPSDSATGDINANAAAEAKNRELTPSVFVQSGKNSVAEDQTKERQADAGSATSNNGAPTIQTSSPKAEDFFSLRERLPLQVFEDETWLQKLGHWGPVFTAVVSIILTGFVWLSTARLSQQQIDIQERQTELQSQQVKAQLSEMRFKFLNDITAQEEFKKIPAELGLAAHGLDAMPVVHFALGVEQPKIRESAVSVFYRMVQAAASFEDRKLLLADLMKQIESPNKTLQLGILLALVKVGPILGSDERQIVTVFLHEKVRPESVCIDAEGRGRVKEAATFFWARDPNSLPYLLTVARNPRCGDGWIQAMVKLEDVARMQPPKRAELLSAIVKARTEVLSSLRGNVSDEDLESGGFGLFRPEGKLITSFDDFQQRVEEEFKSLAEILGRN